MKTVDFSETIEACDLKAGRYRRLIDLRRPNSVRLRIQPAHIAVNADNDILLSPKNVKQIISSFRNGTKTKSKEKGASPMKKGNMCSMLLLATY